MKKIPDSYKVSLRFFVFDIGNYNLSRGLYPEEFFIMPNIFRSLLSVFNNNLILREFDKPKQYSVKTAGDRAKDYLSSIVQKNTFPQEELNYKEFSDYRYGVCHLAELLANRQFNDPAIDPFKNNEDWIFTGTDWKQFFQYIQII